MAGEPKLNPEEPDVDNAGVVVEETPAPPNKSPDDAGIVPKMLVEEDGVAVLVDSEEPRALGGAKTLTGVEPKIEVEGGLKSDIAGVKDGCFVKPPNGGGGGLVVGPEMKWLSAAEEASYSFCTFNLWDL